MSQRYSQESRRQLRATQNTQVDKLPRAEAAFLARIEEQCGKMFGKDGWPLLETSMMLSNHLKFNERFRLTTFLLGNRCPPQMIAEWYKMRGMLRDHSAVEHVKSIIKAHMLGSLEADGKTVWSTQATADPMHPSLRKHRWDGVGVAEEGDKTRPLCTPTFAHDNNPQRVIVYDGDWLNGPLEKVGVQYMPAGNSYWLDALEILGRPDPPPVKRHTTWQTQNLSHRDSTHHTAPVKKPSRLAGL